MSDTSIVARITGGRSLIGSLVAQRRQTDLTIYRIDQLEKKVDEHNGVAVRTTRLEGRMTEAEHDIRDLKARGA